MNYWTPDLNAPNRYENSLNNKKQKEIEEYSQLFREVAKKHFKNT